MYGKIREVFGNIYNSKNKEDYEILPQTLILCDMLRDKGINIEDIPLSEDEFVKSVLEKYV